MTFTDYCSNLPFKLTALRKDILDILWQAKQPLKAYEILQKLSEKKDNAKPPTVYRVLEFFEAHHVVHKLASNQLYSLCVAEHPLSAITLVMVCSECRKTNEVQEPLIQALIEKTTKEYAFNFDKSTMEIEGTCNKCKKL